MEKKEKFALCFCSANYSRFSDVAVLVLYDVMEFSFAPVFLLFAHVCLNAMWLYAAAAAAAAAHPALCVLVWKPSICNST